MGKHRPHSSVFGPDMEHIGYALQPSLRVEQLWSVTPRWGLCRINYIGSKFVVKSGSVLTDDPVREIIRKFLLLFRVPPGKVSYMLPLHIIFLKPVSDETHTKYFRLIKQYSNFGWTVNMVEPWDCSDVESSTQSSVDEPHVENDSDENREVDITCENLGVPWCLDEAVESEIHGIYDKDFTCTPEPPSEGNFFFDAAGDWCEVMDEGCNPGNSGSTLDWEFEEGDQSAFF